MTTVLDAATSPPPPSTVPGTGTGTGTGRYVAAQVAGAFGQSAGVSAGLVAAHMTGNDAVALVPMGVLALGGALAGPALTWVMGRHSRSAGLLVGYVAALGGAALSLVAAAAGSLWLLVAATAVFGAGNSAVMLTRYVLADAVPAEQRGRAISRSLLATTAGSIVGPNLLGPSAHLARWLDVPDAAGLYVMAVVAFGAAALVLSRSIPQRSGQNRRGRAPLVTTARTGTGDEPTIVADGQSLDAQRRVALVILSVANASMVSVMALAGVHLQHHGHSLGTIGATVSLHVAGMFVGSPLVGRLCDRVGARPVASAGAVVLGVVGTAGVLLADAGIVAVSIVLLLLGVAWNIQVVAGSVLLTLGVATDKRPRVEGRGELAMGLTAGLGTLLAASPLTAVGGFRLVSGAVAYVGVALAGWLSTGATAEPSVKRGASRTSGWRGARR